MGSVGAVWAQLAPDRGVRPACSTKSPLFHGQFFMPRPGIEPGPEVPETSVMSFSLPGRAVRQKTEVP